MTAVVSSQNSIVKNSLYKGALNIFNFIMPLITIPYIYRILSPTSVGDFEYATTFYNYFNTLGVLGIYTYGIREASRNRDNRNSINKIYANLFSIGIFSNTFACVILFLFAFGCFRSESALFTIFTLYSINILSNIFYTEWINEAFEDFRFIAIKTGIIRILYVISIFYFIRKPEDIWIYVLLICVSNLLNYTSSFIYARKYTQFCISDISIRKEVFKQYLPPLFFIFLLNNSSIFYTALDRMMLGSLVNTESVAYYSVGQRIMEMVRSLLITFTYVSLPRLSYYLGNDMMKYKDGLYKLCHIVLLIAIPMSFGLALLSKDIVRIFAGDQYDMAILPLIIFSFKIITLMIENLTSQQILFLHQKEKLVAFINISWGIGNLVLNYLLYLIGVFTPVTAILSTMFIELLVLCTEFIYIKRNYGILLPVFSINSGKYLISALLFIPICLVIDSYIEYTYLATTLKIIICTISYPICLSLMKDNIFIEYSNRILKLRTIKN